MWIGGALLVSGEAGDAPVVDATPAVSAILACDPLEKVGVCGLISFGKVEVG